MIAIKKVLYMSVPLLMAVASGAQADDGSASDSLTVGLGGQYAPLLRLRQAGVAGGSGAAGS